MTYRRFTPRPALRPWIEGVWIQESLGLFPEAPPTTVLPVGRLELLVHFREPFLRVREERVEVMPMAFVLGQRTRAIDVCPSGRTGIVIVGFQPWAAPLLLGSAALELVDASVGLGCLERRLQLTSLVERVGEAPSAETRVALVEDFLLRARDALEPDPLVIAAVDRLNRSWGQMPIRDLARELAISRRHLQRRFSRAVGLGPKRFGRVLRFQKAIGLLRSGLAPIEAAGHCGYVDQAHLSREIKTFSHHSPSAVRRRRPTPLMHYYNSPQVSHFYNTIYL